MEPNGIQHSQVDKEAARSIWQVKQRWVLRFDPARTKSLMFTKISFTNNGAKKNFLLFVKEIFVNIKLFALSGSNLRT
jgi:hypothetical protein